MERSRLFLFFAISAMILAVWWKIVIPLMAPDPVANGQNADGVAAADDVEADEATADDVEPAADEAAAVGTMDETPVRAPVPGENPPEEVVQQPQPVKPQAVKPQAKLKAFPQRDVMLGSLDPKTGYFAAVGTTTTGAAVDYFKLNDERYKSLDEPQGKNQPRAPLSVVNTVTVDGTTFRTLSTSVPQIDAGLKRFNLTLDEVEWEVVETVADLKHKGVLSGVTYRYVSPDGLLEIQKKYGLVSVDNGDLSPRKVRDTATAGYQLKFDITIVNHDAIAQEANYVLQGPVGVPLENVEHTSIYRSVRDGGLDPSQKALPPEERKVDLVTVNADDVVEQVNEKNVASWSNPFRYIGVDVQYVAALIVPEGDQLKSPYVAVAQPMVIDDRKPEKFSDVSVAITSNTVKIKPGESFTHSYSLYAGPKRDDLLEPLAAAGVIEYGWFGIISKAMLAVMNFLHDTLYLPYGIAIICLTIMVRGCMYPISRKQAASAKKMKELQPKIAELKKKYENDKEKFARAQMELFSKHNYNPFAGCLPVILQMPIFIGLYQALRNSVDLRLTPFPLTWIDNLAAPDALFQLPFALPFGLGHDFNLLPLLTVCLFVLQQKMFMPPPADEQQAMQHKMMNFMMIFMGFMFYHVPAGLCVYFIASSLWGIGERKMLDYGKPAADPEKKTDDAEAAAPTVGPKKPQPAADKPARKGFLQKLMEAADAAAKSSQSESQSNGRSDGNGRGDGKKRKKSKR